jgi:hypothetical protein
MSFACDVQGFIVPVSVETRTSKNGKPYTLIETADEIYSDWNNNDYQIGKRYGIFYQINGRYKNITQAFISKEQCGTK